MRKRVRAALSETAASARVLERYDNCGSEAWVLRSRTEPARYKVACDCCRNRWCYPCARARGAVLAANLHSLVAGKRVKLITLTIRHSDLPLGEQVAKLYRCFAALRRRKLWTDAVHGGAAVCEIHHTGKVRGWHPHLHILAEAGFLRHRELSAAWHTITGDSYVVDVRAVAADIRAVRYVTKYVSKPAAKGVADDHGLLVEAMRALHNRRLVLTFGAWQGEDLMATPDDGTQWDYVASLGALLDRARNGEVEARRIIHAVEAARDASGARSPPGTVVPGTVPADLLAYVYA